MMAAQPKRKQRKAIKTFFILRAAALGSGMLFGSWLLAAIAIVPLVAATTERIVTDYHTGFAISGFDPVGYFTQARPMMGQPEHEFFYGGATWRFVNEGNRAAFIAHPEVYMPVFGGYDPTGVARGVAVPGHPNVWLIVRDRLYLFRTQQSRDAFVADSDTYLANAQSQWSEIITNLVGK
jgi:hypothetical protein